MMNNTKTSTIDTRAVRAGLLRLIAAMALGSAALAAQAFPQAGSIAFNSFTDVANIFEIDNFTGANNLGVFPVADDLSFVNATLTVYCANAQCDTDLGTDANHAVTFALAPLTPDVPTETAVLSNTADLFSKVVFSATVQLGNSSVEPLVVNLADATTFSALASVSATLLPSSGNILAVGDTVGIELSPAAAVPEPAQAGLLLGGLGVIAALRRSRRFTRGSRKIA